MIHYRIFLVGMRLLICPHPNERILTLLVDQDINSIPACLQMPYPALCFVDKAADSLISFLLFSVRCHYSHFSSARVLSIVTSLLKNISVIQSANTLIFCAMLGGGLNNNCAISTMLEIPELVLLINYLRQYVFLC